MNSIKKPKVLIVEDNFETIDILKKRLQKKGYKITLATEGKEAIEAAKIIKPDLFILDIMLTGDYSGLDALKSIRNDDNNKDKPVIILSNLDSEIQEARDLGASEYLVKSNVTLGEIVRVVEKYLPH